jgi:hypothetical protein
LKAPVKGFLPADEPATRKNPLYRSIFDGFDKIDGKPTEAERKVGVQFSTSITTIVSSFFSFIFTLA